MGIAESDVAQVRAATDIAALIGEHTALRRVGRRFVGLCPFHGEKTASFSVNAEEGLYHCFGCQRSGDAITFVREVEHCGFVEAVERLAGRAGISIEVTDDPAVRAERQERQRLGAVLERAVAWYHDVLVTAPEAAVARRYLRSRGYDGEVVRRFRLGYAPAGPDALVRAIGGPSSLLAGAGLSWRGESGRARDVFRERVIFPIFDAGGRAVALGGRILPEELRQRTRGRSPADPGPKYRNSAESVLYSKRRTLYGLNWAKNEIARSGEVVVCEGYTDVIGCFRAGVERAVATCGTALTEDHVRQLANFADKRIVLCFDADAAGQNAAARLYEWERRHDVELAVAALPRGSDPGELAERDPAALAAAISSARPFLAFVVERALAAGDLSSPEGRARVAEEALEAIAEHPSPLVRDQYLLQVADRTRFEHEQLRRQLEQVRARGPRPERRGSQRAGQAHDRQARERQARERQPAERQPAERQSREGPEEERAGRGQPEVPGRSEKGTGAAPRGGPGGRSANAARPTDEPAFEEPYDDGDLSDDGPLAPGPRRPAAASDDEHPHQLGSSQPRRPGLDAAASRRRSGSGAARAGRDVLLLALHAPSDLADLLEQGVLDPVLFSDELQRRSFDALLGADQLHDAIATSERDVSELLIELAVGEVPAGTSAEDAVFALARQAVEQALARAGADARLAERSDDHAAHARAAEDSKMLFGLLATLRDPGESGEPAARAAASSLVAWLTRHALEVSD